MQMNRIRILDSIVAQRIAAGEVIDRPQSIIRELLDNAIDAGATTIDVYIQQGGIDEIRIVDNGAGMTRDDLLVCCSSHATSKISRIEDLSALSTLGFRGEALYSIAACSDVTITSTHAETSSSYSIEVIDGIKHGPIPASQAMGTTVITRDLFRSIPGRRKFLKRPQTEAQACKRMFIEKALPFPHITFRFFSDGQLRLFLPATDRIGRVMDAYGPNLERKLFDTISTSAGSFELTMVCGDPALYRTDRSHMQIFVNNRRVDEFSLVQAISYGYDSYLPGGCFPYCHLFITVDPETADFNIHPAKKEVRLRFIKEIHHEVVVSLTTWLSSLHLRRGGSLNQPAPTDRNNHDFGGSFPEFRRHDTYPRPSSVPNDTARILRSFSHTPLEIPPQNSEQRPPEGVQEPAAAGLLTYIGQAFGVFLIVMRGEELYFIDQHAAHERILFDELSNKPTVQPLLLPLLFTMEDEESRLLRAITTEYEEHGFHISEVPGQKGTWELHTIPTQAEGYEQTIIRLIQEHPNNVEAIKRKVYAIIACKKAVKEGDTLDRLTAQDLARRALDLPEPRCPHGRPVWWIVTKDQLYQRVERII